MFSLPRVIKCVKLQQSDKMDRWTGRVALVTGASAGIGAAIAQHLVLKGMKVVGVARRVDRVEELQADLTNAPGKLYPLELDVSKEESILKAFKWIADNLGGVDVLVNNAGVFRNFPLSDGKSDDIRNIFDTNVVGLSICTREAIKSMKSRGVDDGHIIHINSIAGHSIINMAGAGAYAASKFAVTALTEALRQELVRDKSRIRTTSISPGLVNTDVMLAAGFPEDVNAKHFETNPYLVGKDIADAVIYVLGAPAHVQIHELTIKPVGELW